MAKEYKTYYAISQRDGERPALVPIRGKAYKNGTIFILPEDRPLVSHQATRPVWSLYGTPLEAWLMYARLCHDAHARAMRRLREARTESEYAAGQVDAAIRQAIEKGQIKPDAIFDAKALAEGRLVQVQPEALP